MSILATAAMTGFAGAVAFRCDSFALSHTHPRRPYGEAEPCGDRRSLEATKSCRGGSSLLGFREERETADPRVSRTYVMRRRPIGRSGQPARTGGCA